MFDTLQDTVAQLTSPGQMFEITELEINGQPARAWAHAPATLRQLWANTLAHADKAIRLQVQEQVAVLRAATPGEQPAIERAASTIVWLSPCATIPSGCSATGQ